MPSIAAASPAAPPDSTVTAGGISGAAGDASRAVPSPAVVGGSVRSVVSLLSAAGVDGGSVRATVSAAGGGGIVALFRRGAGAAGGATTSVVSERLRLATAEATAFSGLAPAVSTGPSLGRGRLAALSQPERMATTAGRMTGRSAGPRAPASPLPTGSRGSRACYRGQRVYLPLRKTPSTAVAQRLRADPLGPGTTPAVPVTFSIGPDEAGLRGRYRRCSRRCFGRVGGIHARAVGWQQTHADREQKERHRDHAEPAKPEWLNWRCGDRHLRVGRASASVWEGG